ncbi:glycosyltransferase [Donghicola tyrosinivorans]|uniref:GT2 family glycosyltransferase n=1 Tax=Donghicola tyrosinivorans TaxID=1652492 RepID=A0A2T0WXV9_9RHOB|nr:glycosyltransferase [Donghicola tyrosinivorans]PRY91507.1 GT2 family glycosyltransferase [Donghicola tyrosinivorans]
MEMTFCKDTAQPVTLPGRGRNGTLVAVVVTYNRLPMLKQTVERILAEPPSALHRLVVVDNASSEDTVAWLAAQTDSRLDVVRLPSNCGGAGGFAAGLRHAMDHHNPDWLVVMDDDARPASGVLSRFAEMDTGKWDALAAAVYYPSGGICEMNRPSRNPFWRPRVFVSTLLGVFRGRARQCYHLPDSAFSASKPVEIDLTSFVGLFLSRHLINAVGYPDANLFLYGDDVLYTLRARKKGMRIAMDNRLKFEHDCSTFQHEGQRVFRPIWKVYYLYRNGLMMYRRAAGPVFFWMLLMVLAPKWYLSGRRYGSDRKRYLRVMWRAVRDGARGDTMLTHPEVQALAQHP